MKKEITHYFCDNCHEESFESAKVFETTNFSVYTDTKYYFKAFTSGEGTRKPHKQEELCVSCWKEALKKTLEDLIKADGTDQS